MMNNERRVKTILPAQQVSDGAGVKIRRSIGLQPHWRHDPFLMLDCFGSDQAADYLAGFPPHPHRGFETVTYMLDGHMLHEDHLGNRGHLKSGGVQWMTAGRGIIHSEMPQQESGLMRGFQLWLNLPAHEKMKPAAYVDLEPSQIPVTEQHGIRIKVIAGTLQGPALAPVRGPVQGLSTAPLYLDVQFVSAGQIQLQIEQGHHALVYPFEQSVQIQDQRVAEHQAALLTDGEQITLTGEPGSRCLVLAAKPLAEPIVQYGPFVMNSSAEIEQAIRDYQQGTLTQAPAKPLEFR